MKAKIGYFIPEFFSQMHIFLWREIASLESMGVDIDLVSKAYIFRWEEF